MAKTDFSKAMRHMISVSVLGMAKAELPSPAGSRIPASTSWAAECAFCRKRPWTVQGLSLRALIHRVLR